ncbi:MAG: 7-cyano-7-deazaguanine synthase QueC [Nitrospirae bacterium]|nr:7-cyano-7-deazaguanine synthase QueC [Nitrospirota bacterium]
MKKAVVLLSGGVDSATTLAIARSEGFELYAISFDYGQRHRVELDRAKRLAGSLKVRKHLIIKSDLREIGSSALTSEMEVPKDRIHDTGYKIPDTKHNASCIVHRESILQTRDPELIPVTYVPARNTIFLSFALAWAESIGACDIFIGANAIDYSGYPDCRPEFLSSFEAMANLATKASVEGASRFNIRAPLVYLTKAEIIKKGIELGVDYSMTWSCYDPQKNRNALSVKRNELKNSTHHASRITHYAYVPCMRCDSCLLRARGFAEAGIKDMSQVF